MLVETHFVASGNHFLPLSQTFFKEFFILDSETNFSVQKKKYCILLRTFFPVSGNHYLNYKEAYLKGLFYHCYWQQLFLIFQILLPYAVFSSSRNVFLSKFCIPASGNRFSVYLKQYSFIWRFFSASWNHNRNSIF